MFASLRKHPALWVGSSGPLSILSYTHHSLCLRFSSLSHFKGLYVRGRENKSKSLSVSHVRWFLFDAIHLLLFSVNIFFKERKSENNTAIQKIILFAKMAYYVSIPNAINSVAILEIFTVYITLNSKCTETSKEPSL